MPKDTTANKIFDLPVTLTPGQVNTLSFSQDSISEMRLTPSQELEVVFRDGSKVLIENFQELVNSANSCGRDTLIQLSDNTIIYPEELAQKLTAGPVNFAALDNAGDMVVNLSEPKAGEVIERNIESGHEYKFGFDIGSTVSAAQAGQNLILTFKDGGILVLKNYFSATQSELPPAMTLADGSAVDTQTLLTSCKLVQIPSVAEIVADGVPASKVARIASVEPAAGEEKAIQEKAAAKSSDDVASDDVASIEPAAGDDAQNLANIEPAAGAAGGAQIGGRGGYGFSSEPSSTPLGGESPIGAIGATSLSYSAAFINPNINPNNNGGANNSGGVTDPSNFVDTQPIMTPSTSAIQEITTGGVSGSVTGDFGSNGPGTFSLNDTLVVSGSLANGALTAGGLPIVIVRNGDTWTGTANGQTAFTITMNPSTGTYTFNQFLSLDHADGSNPSDVISFQFGVNGTDSDGDVGTTTITINVRDDGPVALNDVNAVGSDPNFVTGNVLANDNAGADGSAKVITVNFNGVDYAVPNTGTLAVVGAYGMLSIAADGSYTYTSSNTTVGTDQFTYVMQDYDGDTSTANLSITVEDINTIPSVENSERTVDETNLTTGALTASGTVNVDFKVDGAGTIAPSQGGNFSATGSMVNGTLTSHGVAVVVTLIGNQYVGKAGSNTVFTMTINNDGSYSFQQTGVLDHNDKTNPNDVINLKFGFVATDLDGDVANGLITVNIQDDGPIASNDQITVGSSPNFATGNVLVNDNAGADGSAKVTKVTFNGTSFDVPNTGNFLVTGTYGTLSIAANGQYTYTSKNTSTGTDAFTYTMQDYDGDTSTAILNASVDDVDTIPVITNSSKTIDETNLNPTASVTGTITANFGADGPGTFAANNNFSSSGSKLAGNLTSNGVAVVVTLIGNQYVGKVGNDTVFTLTLNANGSYTFVQSKPLDHADGSNANDVISLRFGVTAQDLDGDTSSGTITISVRDDAPIAVDDSNVLQLAPGSVTGNVLTNDTIGQDKPGFVVKQVTIGSSTVDVPATGSVTITGAHGTLTISSNGQYSYSGVTEGADQFTYRIVDQDGDSTTAKLTLTVANVDDIPTIKNIDVRIDETSLPAGAIRVSGNTQPNFFSDGPGVVKGTDASTFQAGGVLKNNALTHEGVPVVVTLNTATNTYIGTAGTTTVFTMKINSNGTFTFTQLANLDHGASNAATGIVSNATTNEEISLKFGVTATDADGDTATGIITVYIKDDAPIARDDCYELNLAQNISTGNVLTNDTIGADHTTNVVVWATFNGVKYNIANGGSTTIIGDNGTLVLNSNGQYTYSVKAGATGQDNFTYTICDTDQDISTAQLCFDANNPNPPPPPSITAPEICVLEDGSATMDLNVRPQQGDGDEVLTVTVSGFKPGWGVDTSLSGGTYNSTTGVWSITLAAGQVLTKGPIVMPPLNSDADLTGLVVKATTFDPDSGLSSSLETTTNIIVDAVADRPTLTLTDIDTTSHVVSLNIAAGLNDRDGSEILKEIRIQNLPHDSFLNKGSFDPTTGIWTLTPAQLTDLKITVPGGYIGNFDLIVTAVSEEKNFSGEEKFFNNNIAYKSDILSVNIQEDCGCGGSNTINKNDIIVAHINGGEGDILDISNLIHVDDHITSAINDFVYSGASVEAQSIQVNVSNVANDIVATSHVETSVSIQIDDQNQNYVQQNQSGFA